MLCCMRALWRRPARPRCPVVSDDDPQPIPAATVVVMRERGGDVPELLMLERSRTMRFAGGALVFPGGRVDPADVALASVDGEADDDRVGRIAAIRETIEEAGVALGLTPAPDVATLARLRAALTAGATLGRALSAEAMALDLQQLMPFARWLPHGVPHRIFDTRFYLARMPEGAPDPIVDATENTRLFWMSARDVLDEAAAGRVTIIFPTRRNLERLATFGSFADAVADAAVHPIEPITPWVEEHPDGDRLCIPEGIGYPVTWERVRTALRG